MLTDSSTCHLCTSDIPSTSAHDGDTTLRSQPVKLVIEFSRLTLKPALCLSIILAVAFVRNVYGQEAVPSDLTGPDSAGLSPHEIETLQGQPPATHTTVTGEQLAETPRRLNYGVSLNVRGVYDDNIFISSFD